MEIYKKYRPQIIEDVVGQEPVVKDLKSRIESGKVPHAIMFHGPSGTGKTTIARSLRKPLKCNIKLDNQSYELGGDFYQLNCATVEKPLDTIRDLQVRSAMSPMYGDSRIFVLEEFQALSRATFAQQGLLMMLEDTPKTSYFMICTTDPSKVNKAIQTRCTKYQLELLKSKQLEVLINRVCKKEGVESLSEEVIDKIIDFSAGSARECLVLLEKALGADSEEDQLRVLSRVETQSQAIEVARLLLNPRAQWSELAKILKTLDDEPETVRYMILSYMTNVLLGGGKMSSRAAFIITIFSDNFFDSKKAGLVNACWEVVSGGK